MINFAPLQPLTDLADKIVTRATESSCQQSWAIEGILLISVLFRCDFIRNLNTIIVTSFTWQMNNWWLKITNICFFFKLFSFFLFYDHFSHASWMKSTYFSCSNLNQSLDGSVLFLKGFVKFAMGCRRVDLKPLQLKNGMNMACLSALTFRHRIRYE